MADSLNTTNLSRRGILSTGIAAAGAVSLLGSLPAQASEADANLVQLLAAYVEAQIRDHEAYLAWDEAQANAKDQVGDVPPLIWPSVYIFHGPQRGIHSMIPSLDNPPMDRAAIEALAAQLPEAKRETERSARLRALKEWENRTAEANDAFKVSELKAVSDAAEEARYELWSLIANTPAKSAAGIAVKLAAILHYDEGHRDAWKGRAPIDIPTEMFFAARADALRLAGLPYTFGVDEPPGEYVGNDESEEV